MHRHYGHQWPQQPACGHLHHKHPRSHGEKDKGCVQASSIRPERLGDDQPAQRELLEAQAQLQASQEDAAAAIQEKEAAREERTELEQELCRMKVHICMQHLDKAAHSVVFYFATVM